MTEKITPCAERPIKMVSINVLESTYTLFNIGNLSRADFILKLSNFVVDFPCHYVLDYE